VTVAGLVLAAGAGRRFGGPKALVAIDGERLVDRAVRVLGEGGVTSRYVVQGAADLTGLSGAELVDNPDWAEGMGSSLRVGLAAMPTAVTAVLVVPVDQPGLTAVALGRVLAAADGDPQEALVVATYAGRRGHPVLLGRRHWEAVATSAVGDTGARAFLRTRTDVVEVECADVASGLDVDQPADLESYRTTRG
jgi:CTP:molybdopterin cytidylyltransferase MocA